MSCFCASTISIDKYAKTFRLKGDDNNVTPRSNGWTECEDISLLIPLIDGGMIKFTRRSDKNITVENIIKEYARKIKEFCDLEAFHSSNLTKNSKKKIEMYAEINELQYAYPLAQNKLRILTNQSLLMGIKKLQDEFVEKIISFKIDNTIVVIVLLSTHTYVRKNLKYRLFTTVNINDAKRYTRVRANDIMKGYRKSSWDIIIDT